MSANANANVGAGALLEAFVAGAPRIETYGHYVSPLSTQEIEVYVRQCLMKVGADFGEMPPAAAADAGAALLRDAIIVTLDSHIIYSARLLHVARSIVSASFAGANCSIPTVAAARTSLEIKLAQDINFMADAVSKAHIAKSVAAQVA